LVESPLVIEVREESILTMRTPGNDQELALGFLLGEGILQSVEQIERIQAIPPSPESPVAQVQVYLVRGASLSPVARTRLRRAHAIRPSCGLCGLASAEGLAQNLAVPASAAPKTTFAALSRLLEGMRREQRLFRATGGAHAAAVGCAQTGEVWAVREDIGRHNALDKALGACVERPLSEAAVVLSGRGGFELIVKAARLGVPVVASVSAPSSLAVEIADELGMTLVGFLRDGTGRIYSDDERIS
tara:strand:- start:226 stop:960 length:735 start_codon:yes stop_codon:yes gene_type:complete